MDQINEILMVIKWVSGCKVIQTTITNHDTAIIQLKEMSHVQKIIQAISREYSWDYKRVN